MILIHLACFILGGAVVYLYFAYKEREPKTDMKPPVVYLPPDIEVVKQQVENIYKLEQRILFHIAQFILKFLIDMFQIKISLSI